MLNKDITNVAAKRVGVRLDPVSNKLLSVIIDTYTSSRAGGFNYGEERQRTISI